MMQINDTVTLSLLEEDNKQRVIFRVFPLCTREGICFSEGKQVFPDEGGLRVVPDKREQSTFKERMRTIGTLCVINLVSDGRELTKVRPNRNYAPDKGEVNQNAIYSDVICGFSLDAVFEVIALNGTSVSADAATGALTNSILIEHGKVLYGPVAQDSIGSEGVMLEGLKPFGNDAFLLHTVTLSDGSRHTLYWNPEQIVSWRFKRSEFKRRDHMEAGENEEPAVAVPAPVVAAQEPAEPAPMPETKATVAPIVELSQPEPQAMPTEEPSDKSSDEPEQDELNEATLPIGTKLNILDVNLDFEDQITQLDQPLSSKANLLSSAINTLPDEDYESEQDEAPVRVTGTPLSRAPGNKPRMRGQQEPMQRIVEQQLRQARAVRPGADLPADTPFELVDNPIENLGVAIERAWQSEDIRRRAVEMLAGNQELTGQIFRAMHQNGQEMHLLSAAQAQLEDIEADRLSLIMQLEKAKEEQRAYEKQLLESMSKVKTETLNKLDAEIKKLEARRDDLICVTRELGAKKLEAILDQVGQRPVVLLSALVGTTHTIPEMTNALRTCLSQGGFACTEDDVQSLLINIGLFDHIRLRANSLADARLFAQITLEALGLTDVSAFISDHHSIAVLDADSVDMAMTPVVAVCEKMESYPMSHGYKTILLCAQDQPLQSDGLPCPTITVPRLSARLREQSGSSMALLPTSKASLDQIVSDSDPLLSEGEKWFTALEQDAQNAGVSVDTATWQAMRRFVAVAAKLLRGGFLGAADEAVVQWLVPVMLGHNEVIEQMKSAISELPKTLEALSL